MEEIKHLFPPPPRTLGQDLVNDLVPFLLSVEAELTYLLLWRQTPPRSPGMIIQTLPSLDRYPSLGGWHMYFTAC